jgi:hypothetical protein
MLQLELMIFSFPRSSVGTHTDLATAAKVWIPKEDRGNQKKIAA